MSKLFDTKKIFISLTSKKVSSFENIKNLFEERLNFAIILQHIYVTIMRAEVILNNILN